MSCAAGCGFHGNRETGLCSKCAREWTGSEAEALRFYREKLAQLHREVREEQLRQREEDRQKQDRERRIQELQRCDERDPRKASRVLGKVVGVNPFACKHDRIGSISWRGEPHLACATCHAAVEECPVASCNLCKFSGSVPVSTKMVQFAGAYVPDPRGELSTLPEWLWEDYAYVCSDGQKPGPRVRLDRESLEFREEGT